MTALLLALALAATPAAPAPAKAPRSQRAEPDPIAYARETMKRPGVQTTLRALWAFEDGDVTAARRALWEALEETAPPRPKPTKDETEKLRREMEHFDAYFAVEQAQCVIACERPAPAGSNCVRCCYVDKASGDFKAWPPPEPTP